MHTSVPIISLSLFVLNHNQFNWLNHLLVIRFAFATLNSRIHWNLYFLHLSGCIFRLCDFVFMFVMFYFVSRLLHRFVWNVWTCAAVESIPSLYTNQIDKWSECPEIWKRQQHTSGGMPMHLLHTATFVSEPNRKKLRLQWQTRIASTLCHVDEIIAVRRPCRMIEGFSLSQPSTRQRQRQPQATTPTATATLVAKAMTHTHTRKHKEN